MLERDVEQYFVGRVRWRGMRAPKYKTPSRRSAPDRLVLAGNGYVEFVECKAPGEKPTDAQLDQHTALRKRGYHVHVLDTKEAAEPLIDAIQKRAAALPAPRL